MRRIFILGSTGMLGSMLTKTWEGSRPVPREVFDAENPKYHWRTDQDVIINCAGIIKPYCNDVPKAIQVNSLFPWTLPANTIQIATDCVYSGDKGSYIETDLHDATDVYGKTKSLGEATHIKNLRCSIIGPEIKNHRSLLDWFLAQKKADGYTNHLWNGITTYHFSKICQGAVREGIQLPNIQHIVPADKVTKAELLKLIAKEFNHNIKITDKQDAKSVDRTLSTVNPELNLKLWKAAGYSKPPTIAMMIKELAQL